jgi:hypothetical protein
MCIVVDLSTNKMAMRLVCMLVRRGHFAHLSFSRIPLCSSQAIAVHTTGPDCLG